MKLQYVLLVYVGLIAQAKAQGTEKDSLVASEINPVIVTASRQQGQRADAALSVYQISHKKIAETRANLLTELLNKVPGVVMANFNHEQHTIAIRQPIGLNPYFLYLEDGIPIRPVGIFQNNGLIELNMAAVENIEVVKGPTSSLYGPEAAGGAINFNSFKAEKAPLFEAGFQHDSFGYWQSRLKYSKMIKPKWGIAAAVFYAKQKNGWQASSDYDKLSVNIRSDHQLNTSTKIFWQISSNTYQAEAGGSVDSVTFYSRKYQSQAAFAYRNIRADRARITLEKQWNEKNSTQINLIGRLNSIAQFPAYSIRRVTGKPSIANGERNSNDFKSLGFIAQNTFKPNKNNKIITGLSADYAPNTYWAYYVLLNRDTKTGVYSVNKERPDSMLVDYNAKILNVAAYSQWEARLHPYWKLNLGLRYDIMQYNFDNYLKPSAFAGAPDEQNAFMQLSPKIGLIFQKNSFFGAYTNFSQGFSPPNISQLYRGVKVPELKAATFRNAELGFWAALFDQKVLIDAAIYYMPSLNEVVRYVNTDNSVENKSAGSAIHKGIEYSLSYKPTKDVSLTLSASHARHIYNSFRLSPSQIYDGKEMPQAPHFTGFGEINYKPSWLKGFRIAAEWQRVGEFYKDNENANKYEDKTFGGLKGLSVLHLRSGYTIGKIELYANLNNASNELYTTYVSRSTFGNNFYPAPPRNLTLGVNIKL